MEGVKDLGIAGVTFKDDDPLTEESNYSNMGALNARTNENGPVDLGIKGVTMADQFMVMVNGTPASGSLATKALAESFIQSLPEDQKANARIVPATSGGQQALFG